MVYLLYINGTDACHGINDNRGKLTPKSICSELSNELLLLLTDLLELSKGLCILSQLLNE